MGRRLTILTNNNHWEMLFVDDELVEQYHRIEIGSLQQYTPIDKIEVVEVDADFNALLSVSGMLPEPITLDRALALNW